MEVRPGRRLPWGGRRDQSQWVTGADRVGRASGRNCFVCLAVFIECLGRKKAHKIYFPPYK